MSRERVEGLEEIGKKLKTESNGTCSLMGKRQMMLNTITPCAACKLLRRRCAEDQCPFSPYFSPHEPQKFAAVHKVFGASNVSKMLMEVPESQRADAANCLVYEANVRLRDPVYGCMGEISALQQQVQNLQSQLSAVRAEIITYVYKYREAANDIINASNDHAALAVSVAELPQAPPTPTLPPPAPTPPPPPSVIVSSSSSAPSMYTSPTNSTASYRSISNNHAPYFD